MRCVDSYDNIGSSIGVIQVSELRFESSLTMEEIEEIFKDIDFFRRHAVFIA